MSNEFIFITTAIVIYTIGFCAFAVLYDEDRYSKYFSLNFWENKFSQIALFYPRIVYLFSCCSIIILPLILGIGCIFYWIFFLLKGLISKVVKFILWLFEGQTKTSKLNEK